MSWFDLRTRSPDPNAAILRDLIQAKIDAEIQAHEPEDSEHMEQGVETYSSMNITDDLSWSFLRSVTLGASNRNYVPNEPDLNKLRLWIKNENGGHVLHDHAKMGNIINIMGRNPPTLVKIGDQDGLTGDRLCNIFDGNLYFDPDITPGGQFLRISDNPNIRVQELLSGDSITFFVRLYPVSSTQQEYTVLFSKIDNEQATDGYICLLDSLGYLYFIMRKGNRERTLKTPMAIWPTLVDKADFDLQYFQEQYFKTRPTGIFAMPKPIPFIDLAMTCKFSDMSMSILKDGVQVASTAATLGSGLVGYWRLNEGGNVGTTVQEQTPSQRIAYDSSMITPSHNGTITNALWIQGIAPYNNTASYLHFSGSNDFITVPNYTEIQNITAFSISFWYYHEGLPHTDQYMVSKNTVGAANSFLVYAQNAGYVRLSIWNNSTTRFDITFNSAFAGGINRWYHIAVKWTMGSTGKVFVNGVKVTGGANTTGTLSTGATNLIVGGSVNLAPLGIIHELTVWNRELSDSEVASLYGKGHIPSTFPSWKADPPIPSEVPGPVTNPFQKYYDVPWNGNVAAQDTTKLHARIISGFTNFYDTNDDVDIPGSPQTLPYNAIYDVQPAGGGGGGTATEVYNVAAGSGQHLEFEGGATRGGVRFVAGHAIIGQRVTDVTVRFRKLGSPGTISVGIRKNVDGTFVSLGTFDASASGSGEQSVTVTNAANVYAMVANDIVSIEGADNSIELTQNPSIDPSPTNTTSLEYDGSWGETYTLSLIVKAVAGAVTSGGYPLLKNVLRAPQAPKVYTRVAAWIASSAYVSIGKKVTKVVVSMSKTGTPTGTITCKIFKASSITNVVQIGTQKTAADIPATQSNITFEFGTEGERAAQTYALVNGDSIGIEVTGGTASDVNYFTVHHNDTSSIANINSRYYNTITPSIGWLADNTAFEMIGQIYDGGFTATIPTIYAHMKLDHQRTRAAEHFATTSAGIGKAITKITPRFKKFGNPTGSVSVVIRNSAGTQQTSFGAIDAVADIPAGAVWTPKDFTNLANVRTCAAGDRVSVEYGAGDANNYVMVSMNLNHDNFDASLSYAQEWLVPPGNIYANPGAAPGVTTYDLAGTMSTGGIATDPNGRTRVGQRCNSPSSVMRGKKITRTMVALHKVGSPPAGTFVTIRVRKEGTDAIAAEIGTVLASSLATTATYYTKQNVNNVYVTQQNDILTAEYDYGDDANYVVLTRTKTDIFETTGNLSQVVDYNAPTYNALASDLFGEMWTGGDTYTPAIDEQIIRDPWYHHDLLIGAGGHDWSYYQAVGTIINHVGVNIMPEFRIYRRELTTAQALNLYINRCTISPFTLAQVAKVGTFGVGSNLP